MLVAAGIALLVSYPHEVLITMAYSYFASGFIGELAAKISGRQPSAAEVETDRFEQDAS